MQTIYLDVSNKGVIPRIYAKQEDVGKKFCAVITDSGVPFEIPGYALISVWYEGASGRGNYTDIGEKSAVSVSKNRIYVELIEQMLKAPGAGIITIIISSENGDQIGLWNIQYDVESVAGWGSEGAKDYFSAFSNATENLAEAARVFLPDETLTKKGRPAESYETGLRISTLEGRVNNLSALPDGSTAGDAELVDARIGYDGKPYENVGDHIRDIGKLAHNTSFVADNLVGNIPILVSRQKSSNGGLANRYTTEMRIVGGAKYLDKIEVPVSINRDGGHDGRHTSVVAVANGRISKTEPIASAFIDIPSGSSSGTAVVNVGQWFLPEDTIIVSVLDASTTGILVYPISSGELEQDWLVDQIGEVYSPDGYSNEDENVRFVGVATFYDTIKADAATYISYLTQELTEAQQEQARENIGIITDAKYYPDLAAAVVDVNNEASDNALTNLSGAKVKVFTAENGRLTVMLLGDVSESAHIAINKDIDLVLNGKTLTFTSAPAFLTFAAGTKCVIDGEVAGSKITASPGLSCETIYLIHCDGDELVVRGGTYEAIYSASDRVVVFGQSAAHSNLSLNHCNIYCQNTGPAAVRAIQTADDSYASVSSCNVTAISALDWAYGIVVKGTTEVRDSHIYARTNATAIVCSHAIATDTSAEARVFNSRLVADARGDSAEGPSGSGVSNSSVMFFENADVFGTHSGVSNRGGAKLYVSGGTFAGWSHGGFYFSHGAAGEAFIKDSVILCGNYPSDGFFTDIYKNDVGVLSSLYIGGGSDADSCNMTVYLDGCVVGYPGTPPFAIRGTSGEQNNTVNISNSIIVDGSHQIRVDNATHKLNVGIGGNITVDKIDHPEWAEFTNKNYRRYHSSEKVDGKGYDALLEKAESAAPNEWFEIADIVTTTEQNAIYANANMPCKEIVAQVILPDAMDGSNTEWVGVGPGLYDNPYGGTNVDTGAKYRAYHIKVIPGMFAEIVCSYTGSDNFWSDYDNLRILRSEPSATQAYLNGFRVQRGGDESTNNYPVGTRLKVWGLKA